ncbi:uncharacterized protein LOC124776830 isoform X2 [Schistocerca piceifrons]|uniref:uncharacterized protein LOC124776830 isoform X2 n=1 Tax=Schistocerca piceifrons TaxID=274613 RepID=UPI001F5E88D9|nr:uncharacterized protein LOC124776830 isoform X2 [Schistocerca piceifrons]
MLWADQEVQPLWSSYRKPTPCPESDPESDNQSYASEASSDESVQWEKEFIGKLMKVKKYSCQQERTAPASEGVIGTPVEEELPKHCDVNQDTKQSNCQQQESEVLRSILHQDIMGSPGSPTNSQVSSTCDSGCMEEHYVSCLHEHENTRQKLHYKNHQFGEVNKHDISGVTEQQPGCSNNCCVSSSCDSNQLQLRPDIETEDHICGKLNLGYVSRWMKAQPASPTHCEVSSSSYDSESDDGHAGSREQERERQNQTSLQQAQPNSDFILAGTSEESEKMIESPRNCQVSSSCESDSDASGYSKLCLRVSEDSMEDDTDHSSGKDKRKKSCGTSAAGKDGDDTHINARPEQYKSVESVNYDVSDEVPTQTAPLSPRIKRRNISHLGQLGSYSQLDSNQPSHRRHQWTRDFPCRGRPARLRSQSPADRVSRWKRSPSPVESCRKLRSRSVLPIRDTQRVTWRKRRSKSCDAYRNHKRSHESRHPSKEHLLFKRMEPVSEPSLNNRVERQSRSTRRRWSKPASISGRHKTSTSSRDKSTLQMTSSNSESLSVRMAARCIHCSSSHKFQKEHSVLESECAIQGRSHVNQTLSSKTQNVAEEQLTYRTRRSLSRSRSVLNTAQEESGAEVIGTKIMHSLSRVQENSSGKEQPPQGFKEHTRNQSMCLNTSKRNKRTSKKKEAPKEHVTTLRSDSVIQNQKSFTQLNKCCELAQEQPAFGSKLSVRINRLKNTEDFRTNQLSGEQSSLEDKYLITDDISARLQHSGPEDAFRKKIHSHRSQVSSEERPTSSNKQSLAVNMSRGQNHLNKFQEIKDQSTFSSTNSLLTKSSEDVHLSKGKELSYDHVADSSCLMPKNNAERHTESKKNQELAGGTLNLKNFKGFPEEQVSVNGKLSLPAIISESCDFPISTQALHQLCSASKRHSASVLTQGTSSSLNEVKMAPDPLSDSKRLSRKRKLSKEDYQSQHKSLKSRCQFLSAPCVACENQGHLSKRRVLGKVKQSAEAVQSILQSNNMKVSKNKALLLQTATYNSHLQLGHSSTVNGSTASSEISQEKSYSKISGRNSSLFKDASAVCDLTASDARVVKCSSQDRICCKEDSALLGPSTSQIKPCSVVLKNLELSSEKFVFPPFPHVTWTTKVIDFCLPQDYMNTVWKKDK